jgi:glycosyltransferase involved in cell wall biosynthesis
MCGLPVIGSNYSGLTDFLNEENSFLIEPECIRPKKEIEWISYYYQGMPVADYGRESIDKTRKYMRYVYENYGNAKEKNKKLQKYIKENYDWNDCVDKMHDRLKEIYIEIGDKK